MIKWATNPSVTGKLPEGEMYKLGSNWVNLETSVEDFFMLVAVDGRPFCPNLKETENGKRNGELFVSSDIALVDIDDGMTIQQLDSNAFYQEFGAGYYTTPSHSAKLHKFRMIFILEETITDRSDMELLYSALIREFGGDEACKDAARLFFGTVHAERRDIDGSKRLPKIIVDALIQEAKQVVITVAPQHYSGQLNFGNGTLKSDFNVDNIKPILDGNRDKKLFNIAHAMKMSGVPFHEAVQNITMIAQTKCMPPFNVNEAIKKVKRQYKQ